LREIVFILVIIASIPFVFRRPIIGLTIYLCANIIRPEMIFWGGGGGAYFFKTYYILTFTSCFINGTFTRPGKIFQKEYLLMLWLFVGIVVSALFSQFVIYRQDYYIIEIAKDFGLIAIMYLLVDTYADIKKIQNVMIGCFAFMGVWGMEQLMRGNERLEGLGGSSWGDSNGVAAVFVLFLPVALALAFSAEKRRDYWLALCAVGIMIALIIGTKSRGGLLGMTACLVAYGYFSRKGFKIIKVVLVLALIILPFAADSYFERMKSIQVTDNENMESSAKSRIILWQAGLMVFADNPLIGTGFMTYPEAKMRYEGKFSYLENNFREWVFRREAKKVTHNSYIQMLADCGLVGATPFVLLVIGGIQKGFWARRKLIEKHYNDRILILMCGACAGVTGFAVCIFFIDAMASTFLYVQLGIIGLLYRMALMPKGKSVDDQAEDLL
jgi:O-antigen ligase